ncbi:Tol-Pal system beta propeller repeat protein TolB [Candidatus Methylocalor cossyra]|uniref:Tol-Pal system protein TolB n=1 Tax=Candidatus Methylocalor cossyra TaxID=3108543 RepID=A0ABP1CC90_9GAMM
MINRFCIALLAGLMGAARAELNVDITKGVQGAIPIAIVPFAQQGLAGDNLGSIVAADLARSGRFKPLPESELRERPVAPEQVNFRTWQALGQDYLAIGRVLPGNGSPYQAEFYLFDAIKGTQLTSGRIPFAPADARHAAHRIADLIYQELTGERGAFNTRVAYVTVTGSGQHREFHLQIADTDGHDPQSVISSPEPIMSPAWSPDGTRIAYVSFENKTSAIFVQTLATGERQKISEAPGINGAPAWSPDGTRLALTLSKDGSPDIYVMDLATRALRRITDDLSIDTEPSWSPDGQSLVFTSDRGGKPQLYRVSAEGGQPERLTYDGSYNARGVFSPDGRSLAMVHGNGGDYRIAVMDLGSRALRVLTDGPLDESPGFAPNGSMILYTQKSGGVDQLAAVSVDGKVRQTLRFQGGQVREPAWSP